LIGLVPALMTPMIRAWVPESPRWLIRRGRREDARRSIAWALQIDPNDIELPGALPELQHARWRELFKYPRSAAFVCLIGLSQTSGVGLALWAPTLLLLLLKITPAEASYLMIWVGVSAFVGRVVCSFLPDLIGCRTSGMLTCLGGVATLIIAGYLADAYIGTVSVFWLMLMGHSFFGGGSYTIIAPYMAEVWPAGSIRLESTCSRTRTKVWITALPISLPSHRAIWIVAPIAAACGGVMLARPKVISAVIAKARPTASISCETRKSPLTQS
jgi:putative MFS transporter